MSIIEHIDSQYKFMNGIKLSRTIPKAIQVYDILRSAIIDLLLPPGAPIKKELIGTILNVSRTPVSDAVNRLESIGLLEVFPQHGTFVSRIRRADVQEGAFLRRVLEVAAARELAERISQKQIDRLHKSIRYQESALSAHDLDDLYFHDKEFHRLICAFTGFPRLSEIVDGSRGQLDRVRKLLLPDAARPAETIKEHKAIVAAIESGNPDAAETTVSEHLDKVPDKLEQLILQRPELFDV